ncbi:MAG: hypothetical protein ACT4PJ_14000 [Gemmatimonadaceae bacterium]
MEVASAVGRRYVEHSAEERRTRGGDYGRRETRSGGGRSPRSPLARRAHQRRELSEHALGVSNGVKCIGDEHAVESDDAVVDTRLIAAVDD